MAVSIIGNSDIISVLRGVETVDEYNSKVIDWSNPITVASGRASVQFFQTTEDDVDRQTTVDGLRLISDDPKLFGVIQPTDRILYNGITWEVNSQVQDWRLFAKMHHIEVFLRRVIG